MARKAVTLPGKRLTMLGRWLDRVRAPREPDRAGPSMPRYAIPNELDGWFAIIEVDDVERVFRRLPAERRERLKRAGGIAEQLLRHTTAALASAKAIFGYVGDIRAERVDLRAEFEHTGAEHLIVFWPRPLPREERQAIVARVARLGPF